MTSGYRIRIAICSGLPLAQNPRSAREAATLAAAGYEVIVLGAELLRETLDADQAAARRSGYRFVAVGSLRPAQQSRLRAWYWRLRHRLGRDAYRLFRIENVYQVGYFVPELAKQARAVAADYYVLHAEQGLWVGPALLSEGRRIGVDMEDWYSEDLLPAARALRPLRQMRMLEATLLTRSAHSTCPSHAMSAALAREFGCPAPTVIYNASSRSFGSASEPALRDRKECAPPSVHWFSQTLGEGRGFDDLLACLPLLRHPAQFHLRGAMAAGFGERLFSRIPPEWRPHFHIHEPVPETELLSRVAEHDIGFAGEQKYCRSRDLTITNKILTYLGAGLAVVASDTAGQAEVAAAAGDAVFLYQAGNPQSLAAALDALLSRPEALANMKSAALNAADETFSWEKMAPVLLQAVQSGLGRTGVRKGST